MLRAYITATNVAEALLISFIHATSLLIMAVYIVTIRNFELNAELFRIQLFIRKEGNSQNKQISENNQISNFA